MSDQTEKPPETESIARNEPCPCGSGKKYKRCHGVAAAPKLSQPKNASGEGGAAGLQGGLENVDPALVTQAGQMLQRLPRGQRQRLQSIMQRAMAGKDVAREAEEFQKTLPPEFQHMLTSFAAVAGAAQSAPSMSEEDARAIVAQAAKEGKVTQEQADALLQEKPSGLGKLWKNITGTTK